MRFSLAWSVYWTWSLVFLGLAAAYQMQAGKFPWLGHLHEADINTAQRVILAAHCVTIIAFFITRKRKQEAAGTWVPTGRSRLRKWMMLALAAHTVIVAAFAVIMGPSMFAGRYAFQQSVLSSHNGIPGFGTMYFLSNAGAMILPAMAITLRKCAVNIPLGLIWLSGLMSFLATNPLIGSRFLTGSFLVAVMAALVAPEARRWLPAGVILAFVTVFPTLDLLRGDGTGSTAIQFTPPSQTLTTFDYDAFEMLVRAVSLHGQFPSETSPGSLLVAPFLRWVPFLSDSVQGHASGPFVARYTGMGYTNVSMPLWAEMFLIGSWVGVVIGFAILGVLLARSRRATAFGTLIEAPTAALLFIVLRGSLYEVLGYLLLAVAVAWAFGRLDHEPSRETGHETHKSKQAKHDSPRPLYGTAPIAEPNLRLDSREG
jgi:hypothetical protein